MLIQPVDWVAVGNKWGLPGVITGAAILLLAGLAKFVKAYITKRDEENAKLVQDTINDARRERDASRQLLKEQAMEFTRHLKEENEEFRDSLREVVATFERERGRRK